MIENLICLNKDVARNSKFHSYCWEFFSLGRCWNNIRTWNFSSSGHYCLVRSQLLFFSIGTCSAKPSIVHFKTSRWYSSECTWLSISFIMKMIMFYCSLTWIYTTWMHYFRCKMQITLGINYEEQMKCTYLLTISSKRWKLDSNFCVTLSLLRNENFHQFVPLHFVTNQIVDALRIS